MSLQAEQGIISCLLEKNSLMQNCDLTGNQFAHESLGEIYDTISQLINGGQIADIVTIGDLMRGHRQDHLSIVVDIAKNTFASISGFDSYIKIIGRSFKTRTAKYIAHSLQYSLDENGDLGAIDKAISDLMAIDTSKAKHSHTMDECVKAAVSSVEKAFEANGVVGISTGLKDLDDALGGFHKSDLIVIGARPAMGKTALLLNMANSVKSEGCGIISSEQSHEQAGLRFIGMNGSVDGQKMRTGKMEEDDWPKLTLGVTSTLGRPCYLNDEPGISITRLIKQAREWKFKYDIKVLFVDYIQKIKGSDPKRNRYEQVTEVTGALKNLARELDIPVVALAQVKRDVDSREDERPRMGDMSDASEIEKEADIIMTMYRDEVSNPDTEYKGVCELDVCKNRHGPIGIVRAHFIGRYMQFKDLGGVNYD